MFSKKELSSVLNNRNTQTLVNWLGEQSTQTKYLLSTEFFHPTYSERDKAVLISLLESFFDGVSHPKIKITRVGKNSASITFS